MIRVRRSGAFSQRDSRVERLDIITGARIREVEHAAGEQLEEKPGPPAKAPGWFPPQPVLQSGGIDRFHRGGDHAEIERLMSQRKAQMCDDRTVRCVLSRIELDGVRAVISVRLAPATT
jgi:hypothetical protein